MCRTAQGSSVPPRFIAVLVLGVCILSSVQVCCGEEWIWNNATGGIWDSERWYTAGSTSTLTCCPLQSDVAVVNATGSSAPYEVLSSNPNAIDSLIVGSPSGLAYPVVYLSQLEVRSIQVHNGSFLVAGPGLEIFSVSEGITCLPGSRMYIFNSHLRPLAPATRFNITLNKADLLFPDFPVDSVIENVWINMSNPTLYSHVTTGTNVTLKSTVWVGNMIGLMVSSGFYFFKDNSTLAVRGSDVYLSQFGAQQQATIARMYFVDSSLELVDSSTTISNGMLYAKGSTVQISNPVSFTIARAGQAYFDTGSNVTMVNSLIQLQNASFIKFYTCSANLIGSTVVADGSYFVIYDESNVTFDGQVFLVGQSVMWVQQWSTLNISWVLTSVGSQILCYDSTVHSYSFHMSGQMSSYGCRIDAMGSWYLGVGAAIYAEQSVFSIAGSFALNQYSTLYIQNNTQAEVDGSLSLELANVAMLDSAMMARGSIYTANCIRPAIWEEFLTNNTIFLDETTRCLLAVFSSNFSNSGDIILAPFSIVIFQDSQVQSGGYFSMGNDTYVMTYAATMRLSGQLHMGTRAQVRCTGSTYIIDQGNMIVGDNAFMKTWQAHFEIEGGSFACQNGQTHLVHSSLNVSGGDIMIDAAEDPRIDTLIGYNSFSLINSSALVNGGSFSGSNRASVAVFAGSVLNLNGGSMNLVNSTRLNCDSSNITVSGAGFFVSNSTVSALHCNISIASGDLALNQGAFMLLKEAQLDIGGSMALTSGSQILIAAKSTLQLLGGGIFLDDTADVLVDGNSTILGAGSVTGRLTVISGTIGHRVDTSPTNLTIGSWKQSNESRMEVTISSQYGTVPSSTIVFASNVTIAGTLSIQVDSNMEERLRNGERVVIVSSSSEISGQFDHLDVSNPNLACGIGIQNSGRSLAVLFDTNKCPTPSPTASEASPASATLSPLAPSVGDGSIGGGGLNTIAIAVGVTIAVVVVLGVVAGVILWKVPRLRKRIAPWRREPSTDRVNQEEMNYAKAEQSQAEPSGSKWTASKPTATK